MMAMPREDPPPHGAAAAPDQARLTQAVRAVLDRQGRAQTLPPDIRLRLAGPEDISVLTALNADAIREWGRAGLFMPMPEAFFGEMIRDGIILLPERAGKVQGYSIAVPAGGGHPPFLPADGHGKTGLMFGTALDPALRGQGWQHRLIRLRLEAFQEAGFAEAQSTVSPFNTPSLRNLLRAGFCVTALKTLLDKHPRFVLQHDFGRTVTTGPKHGLPLPQNGDLPDHAALLADGFVAVGLEKSKPVTLFYAARRHQDQGTGCPPT